MLTVYVNYPQIKASICAWIHVGLLACTHAPTKIFWRNNNLILVILHKSHSSLGVGSQHHNESVQQPPFQ